MSDDQKNGALSPIDNNDAFYEFDYAKMPPEGMIFIGRAMAYAHLANAFEVHASKTLDIRERQVLNKVVQTCRHHQGLSSVKAAEIGKECKAVKKRVVAPTTDTAQ